MGDVIPFAERHRATVGDEDSVDDRFLIDEGLDLLSHYRSIKDMRIRNSLLGLIAEVARSQQKDEED